MAPRKRRLPANAIKNFRNVYQAHIQAQKPGWTSDEVASCLTFMWREIVPHDEKCKYGAGTYRPNFPWTLPVNAPPENTTNNREPGYTVRAKVFREDAANWPQPPPNPNTTIPTTQLQALHNQINAMRGERDDMRGERDEIRGQNDTISAEKDGLRAEIDAVKAQRDKLAADAAARPEPGSPQDSGRLESMKAELAALRRKVAAPGHWPNLAHLPVPDPIPPGTDPTGFREGIEVFGQEDLVAVRWHPHEKDPAKQYKVAEADNKYARGRDVALMYERMIFGDIEGVEDGSPGRHDGGSWKFERFLGQGSFGTVGLWRKRDETTGQIMDSVAVKDEETWSLEQWVNPLQWRDGLPIEIWMHEHFKKIKPACPYLVPSRGYRLNLEQRRTRLYLEFMPGHSLRHLMRLRDQPVEDGYEIPHEFIFYAFLALAEACLALDRGWWGEHEPAHEESSTNEGRREGWVSIVHRDMKPGNIFLGLTYRDETKKWDMFPTPVLADFGMAFEAYADDPYNPENYVGTGTIVYMAPEQYRHSPLRSRYANKLSDRTNVFAIAASIFELWQGRLPGFLANEKKPDDDVREMEDDERHGHFHVPPPRDDTFVQTKLQQAHEELEEALHVRGKELQPFQEWLNEQAEMTMGAENSTQWINLWELESWKTHWLLRNIFTSVQNNKNERGWEFRELKSPWELKLADILRRCLEWDPNDRPSIRTLRDMLHDAIRGLEIKPNGADETQIPATFQAPHMKETEFNIANKGAGLIYFMDEEDTGVSMEYLARGHKNLLFRYKEQKLIGWRDLRRRAFLSQFRPLNSSVFSSSPTTPMTSSSDGGGGGGERGDKDSPFVLRKGKRKRQDNDV